MFDIEELKAIEKELDRICTELNIYVSTRLRAHELIDAFEYVDDASYRVYRAIKIFEQYQKNWETEEQEWGEIM